MILTRRVIPGLALCLALVTLTTVFYQGIGEAPVRFFGGEDVFLIAPPGNRLLGTATVPDGFVGPLAHLETVQAASPEIYIPTAYEERSIMARGADPAAFLRLEGGALVAGHLPESSVEALVGQGFADAFDVGVGDPIVLPGAFVRSAAAFTIVGVFDVDSPARDEVVLSLDAARGLVGVPPGQVHVIRVATNDTQKLKTLVESVAPAFTYSDVRLSTTRFLPGEMVAMRANLTNWGRVESVKIVTVRQENLSIAEKPYSVPAFTTIPVELEFRLPVAGRYNITINPTFNVDVVQPNLTFVDAPHALVAGHPLALRVKDGSGHPASGVALAGGNLTATTDGSGQAVVSFPRPGRVFLTAQRNLTAGESAVLELYVVHPNLAANASATGTRFLLSDRQFGDARPIAVRVEVENRGGVAGNVSLPILLNGTAVAFANASLDPGARALVAVSFPAPKPGLYALATANGTAAESIEVVQGNDPRIEALLRAYEEGAQKRKLAPTSGDSADDYVTRTIGNLGAAVLILSLVSGALASLGAIAILSRHIAERRSSMGVLKALGASDEHVVEIATWETARWGSLACALGVGVGLAAALLVDRLGIVRAFGHAVHPVLNWTTLGLIFLVGVVVLVIAARAIVRSTLASEVDALLRGTRPRPDDAVRPLRDVLGGAE